jgi:WD40 repeat protein
MGPVNLLKCFLLLCLLTSLAGCDRLRPSQDAQKAVDAYVAYRTALSAGDLEQVTPLLAAARREEIAGDPSAPDKLRLAAFLMPGTMTVMGVAITEGKATLTLREGAMAALSGGSSAPALGPVPGITSAGSTGTVTLVKEGKIWKVDRESWHQTMDLSSLQAAGATPFFQEGEPLPRLLRTMGGDAGGAMGPGVAATPDGTSLVTVGEYSIIRLRAADGSEMASARMEHRPTALTLTPDGTTAVTADAYGGVTFWPLTLDGFGPPQRRGDIGHNSGIALSRDGRLLATASYDKLVTLWDVAAQKEVARVTMPVPMRSVAFSPTGQLLAAGSAHNTFTLWDLESGAGRTYTIAKVDEKSDVSGIAFSPDGKRLATSHMDSSITLWDVLTQKEAANFFVSQSSSWSVRFSADGGLFATATQGGGIHLWHGENGAKLGVLQGQPSQPRALAFSPDGALLYVAGEKGEIGVWGRE